MMQQIILNKKKCESEKAENQTSLSCLAGSDAKNALPANNICQINAMDLIGLSWIFAKEDDFDIC